VGLFNSFATERKLELLQDKYDKLARDFLGLQQEWDAVQARVTKVLRRITRAEQAALAAEEPPPDPVQTTLPLTGVTPSSDRMAKIREQLAAKGR